MSPRQNAPAKNRILTDVYHDNRGKVGASERVKQQRAQRARQHRTRFLARATRVAVLLPLAAFAVSWQGGRDFGASDYSVSTTVASGTAAYGTRMPHIYPGPATVGALAASENPTRAAFGSSTENAPALASMAGLKQDLRVINELDLWHTAVAKRSRHQWIIGDDWFKGYETLIAGDQYSMAQLFGLRVQTIVIDAGHGGWDPGAIGVNGLKEKTVTLAVARALKRKLEQVGGYRVLLTRRKDRYVSLKERVAFANEHNADLFISIHVNSLPQDWAAVVETFYFGPTSNPAHLRLAKMENSGSMYSIGDFRKMISSITNTFKRRQSRQLATSVNRALFRNMHRISPQLSNSGIDTAPFVVLLGTKMPSILIETTAISNAKEARRLTTSSYRQSIASFIKQGIVRYLGKLGPEYKPEFTTVNGANNYVGKRAVSSG